eukprot:TRINITY_DN3177_c0_g1::TRINITY_DN3177_c0_g1_i1::g.3617::m.3617 TRINITY_DN3177_c0_g1::TRINITY_DN3177_c0_g1_i1::g.3617  ORF type:complete len:233 (+),score=13.01,Shisa/PF13908.1/0.35,Prominin/PF05478.6/2.9 TRINITY_DN3177_c0_g1_i1:53-700(+)
MKPCQTLLLIVSLFVCSSFAEKDTCDIDKDMPCRFVNMCADPDDCAYQCPCSPYCCGKDYDKCSYDSETGVGTCENVPTDEEIAAAIIIIIVLCSIIPLSILACCCCCARCPGYQYRMRRNQQAALLVGVPNSHVTTATAYPVPQAAYAQPVQYYPPQPQGQPQGYPLQGAAQAYPPQGQAYAYPPTHGYPVPIQQGGYTPYPGPSQPGAYPPQQ